MGVTRVGCILLAHADLDRVAQTARHWATRDCPVVIHCDKIIATEELIRQAQLDLEQNQKSLETQIKGLKADLGKRKTIISSLDKELKQQGGSLSRLQDEATQLKNLIKSIEEIFVDAPESEISQKAFAELKGKLAWPVKGKLKKLFGRNKPQSELRWQGVVIEAPNGRQVKAVSHGRIAFSDWLRGLGNLSLLTTVIHIYHFMVTTSHSTNPPVNGLKPVMSSVLSVIVAGRASRGCISKFVKKADRRIPRAGVKRKISSAQVDPD